MDYSAIKAAMREVGHEVTEGVEWAAKDAVAFRDYCHRHLGIPFDMAHRVIEYPTHFMHILGETFHDLFGTHHTVIALDPDRLPPSVKAPAPGMLAEPIPSTSEAGADASGMLTPPVEQPAEVAPEAPPAPPAETAPEAPPAPPADAEGAASEGTANEGTGDAAEGDKASSDSTMDLTPKE
jgi:hypothetical protein